MVGGDESTLAHEGDDGQAQPAVASSREGAPPDVGDGGEKRHGDRSVAGTKSPCRGRQLVCGHAPELHGRDGARGHNLERSPDEVTREQVYPT